MPDQAMNTPATQPANNDTVPSPSNQANANPGADNTTAQPAEDKVMMKDDKVYVIKSGDSTLLADSITLGSGAVVRSDASVTFSDGSTAQLKNGQYIALTTPPPAAEPAAPATPASPTDASTPDNASSGATAPVEDRVVMTNDQVMIVKSGDSTLLADSIKLNSGAIVQKDGSVRFKDGTTTTLKNGQYISLNPSPATETKKTKKSKTKKEN
jgi:hypothetical protein